MTELADVWDLKSQGSNTVRVRPPPFAPYYPDVAQLGRAPALGAGCRMFKSCHLDQYSSIVQSVERWTVNPYVAGSNPARGAIMLVVAKWLTR